MRSRKTVKKAEPREKHIGEKLDNTEKERKKGEMRSRKTVKIKYEQEKCRFEIRKARETGGN